MKLIQTLLRRVRSLGQRQAVKHEIDDELRFHIDQRVAENIAAGMTPDEAAQEARKRFGNMQSFREDCREVRGASFGEAFMKDIRFGARMLWKNPGFTSVAVLTLALGIGATTAVFSIVNAVVLRPLSFPDSDRLLWVSERSARSGDFPISFPDYADWRAQQSVFEEVGVYNWGGYNLTGSGNPRNLRAGQMTATAFAALRTQPVLGRVFSKDEDKPGAPHVVVLSHAFWLDQFGGDPGILNRAINLDSAPYTVVGVMPAGFAFPDPVDIWVPLGSFIGESSFQQRGDHPGLEGVARLKVGVTLKQARAEMEAIARRLEQQYPDSNRDVRVSLVPLLHKVVGNVRGALWTLLGSVALVLLIACANVANLLLARATVRQNEMALRAALGAGRWRIVGQLLTESVLLATIGGGLGFVLAHWCLGLILALGHNAIPRAAEIHLDGGVLGFTLLAALTTGVLFGLFPAWQASRPAAHSAIADSSRGSTRGHSRLRQGLIVAEVSLTLILLIGAGLLLRSFHNLQSVNPGFSSQRVMSFRMDLPDQKYATFYQQNGFYQALVEKLEALPGVSAAGVASRGPLEQFNWTTEFLIEGQPEPAAGEHLTMDATLASPDYFRAMGIPLLRGRAFTDQDNREHLRGTGRENDKAAGANVIIVDEEFVHRHWPNEDPIGKKIVFPWGNPDLKPNLTVVGVVARVKVRSLSEKGGLVQGYLPAWQLPETGQAVVVKTTVPPDTLFGAVREQVRSLDPDQPISNPRSVEELRGSSLSPQRLNLALLGLFGGVALALASIGLYGVLAYSVAQRRREIGVRMALGAPRGNVIGLVVWQGAKMALAGILIGLIGALALTRVLASMLFEVNVTDPITFTAVPLILTAVALLACWLPARRAAKVDPMVALRHE